jgi:hypothetical protein
MLIDPSTAARRAWRQYRSYLPEFIQNDIASSQSLRLHGDRATMRAS